MVRRPFCFAAFSQLIPRRGICTVIGNFGDAILISPRLAVEIHQVGVWRRNPCLTQHSHHLSPMQYCVVRPIELIASGTVALDRTCGRFGEILFDSPGFLLA